MKIGVFVGSFDPVHIGHKKVMDHLIDNNYVDKIIVVPTQSYWNKKINTSIVDRINMLNFYENENIIIGNKYSNLLYTYEVLNSIKKDYDAEIYLIIGADNIIKFHLWKNVNEILRNKVLVLGRNNLDVQKNIDSSINKDRFVFVKDFKEEKISSSFIRESLKQKKYEKISCFLNDDILKYIIEKKLYDEV